MLPISTNTHSKLALPLPPACLCPRCCLCPPLPGPQITALIFLPPAAASAAGPFVGLYAGPSEQHPVLDAAAVTNEEAWRQGRLLRIGDASYEIELNPPLLDRIELHARPFVGIPLVPALQVRVSGHSSAIQVLWQMRGGRGGQGAGMHQHVHSPACCCPLLPALLPPPCGYLPAAALF